MVGFYETLVAMHGYRSYRVSLEVGVNVAIPCFFFVRLFFYIIYNIQMVDHDVRFSLCILVV